jgi:DNA-binding transcriptional LysR family regulator
LRVSRGCGGSLVGSIDNVYSACLVKLNAGRAADYELLRTFLAAAAARTFGEAARRRFVTVSAISQQVKTLETQLGVALFERLGRRVRLSDAGRALQAALAEPFARIEEAVEAAASASGIVRGRLTLGAPRTFGRFWLRPRLAALLSAHPELRVTVQFDVPSVLERRLVEGVLDLALLARGPELPGVEAAPLHIETFVAVAAPAYTHARGTPRTLADFRAHRYLVFDAELAMHAPWWRASFGARAPLPVDVVCEVASLEELLALAEAGLGIAVLPDYQVEKSVAAGRVRVLVPGPRARPARNTVFLAGRRGAIDSPRLRAARAALR